MHAIILILSRLQYTMDFVLKVVLYSRSNTFKANLERRKTKTFSTNPALSSEAISYSFHHNHCCLLSTGVGLTSFSRISLRKSLAVFYLGSGGHVLQIRWSCSKSFLHSRVCRLVWGRLLGSLRFVVNFRRLWLLRLCSCLCWSHCLRGGFVDNSDIYI